MITPRGHTYIPAYQTPALLLCSLRRKEVRIKTCQYIGGFGHSQENLPQVTGEVAEVNRMMAALMIIPFVTWNYHLFLNYSPTVLLTGQQYMYSWCQKF